MGLFSRCCVPPVPGGTGAQKLLCLGDSHTEAILGTDWVGRLGDATRGRFDNLEVVRAGKSERGWWARRPRVRLAERGARWGRAARPVRTPLTCRPAPLPVRVAPHQTGGEWTVLIGRRLGPLLDANPNPAGVVILAGTNDVLAATSEPRFQRVGAPPNATRKAPSAAVSPLPSAYPPAPRPQAPP
jgi:hypothetical protein